MARRLSSSKGSLTFHNSRLGIVVVVTKPAQTMIGAERVPEFVRLLTEMMDALGCTNAYVGRDGSAVGVWIHHRQGWTHKLKLQRKKGFEVRPTEAELREFHEKYGAAP